MGYFEQFIEVLTANSEANNYDEAISEWVYHGETFEDESNCICGHPIMENCIVHNRLNNVRLIIGNCCIRKFGVEREHWNKSRRNYLEYALQQAEQLVKTDNILNPRINVSNLIKKLETHNSLYMSEKQKDWLERLTGKPYRFNYKKPWYYKW